MLYDKRWDRTEVKSDPFSLESLIAWMEKQPSDETYCFTNWGGCLLAKWTQSMDPLASPPEKLSREQPTGFHYAVNGQVADLTAFQKIASGTGLGSPNWTFGAALERARAALARA